MLRSPMGEAREGGAEEATSRETNNRGIGGCMPPSAEFVMKRRDCCVVPGCRKKGGHTRSIYWCLVGPRNVLTIKGGVVGRHWSVWPRHEPIRWVAQEEIPPQCQACYNMDR